MCMVLTLYSVWDVAGDKAEIWDAATAAAHVNVVVAFLAGVSSTVH